MPDSNKSTLARYKSFDDMAAENIAKARSEAAKFAIAVDTNCYIPAPKGTEVDFTQGWQIELVQLAQKNSKDELLFLIPDVWEHEVINFTQSTVRSQLNFQAPQLQHPKLLNVVAELRSVVDKLKMNTDRVALDLWKQHKRDALGQLVSAPADSLPKIMKLYFTKAPPFNEQGDKKAEFPDATALLALEQYALEHRPTKVVVATKDFGCLEYCKGSEHLIGISTPQLALELLGGAAERIRLAELGEQLSKNESNLSAIEKEIRFNIQFLRQFAQYLQGRWHPNIFPPFQPKVRIISIDDVELLANDSTSQILKVEGDSDQATKISGRAKVTVTASGYVNAYDPETGSVGTLPLFTSEKKYFFLDYSANFLKLTRPPTWSVNIDENKVLIPLPEPPSSWEPRPMA